MGSKVQFHGSSHEYYTALTVINVLFAKIGIDAGNYGLLRSGNQGDFVGNRPKSPISGRRNSVSRITATKVALNFGFCAAILSSVTHSSAGTRLHTHDPMNLAINSA